MTTERALSFGATAATYERYRPEYPDRVVELVQEYADTPVRTALELGAGTGKATSVFARHGISVTASEPDRGMLDELRRKLPAVRTVQASLEELPPLGPFDLVFAAASLHWTEPGGRWDRIAGLLVPGGVFASCGGPPRLADAELEGTVQAAQRAWLVDDSPAGPVDVSDDGMHWPATELVADARFTDVRETVIEQRLELTKTEWIGYLSTVSAYLVLSPDDRTAALDAAAAALPDAVEITADLTMHLSRRA